MPRFSTYQKICIILPPPKAFLLLPRLSVLLTGEPSLQSLCYRRIVIFYSLSCWLESILFFNKYISYFLYLGAFSVVLRFDSWPMRSRHAALIFWSLQKLWAWALSLLTWKIPAVSLSVRRPRQKWLVWVLLGSHKESTLISALELLVWK